MVPVTVLSRTAGPMTRAELDALPDDGRRHELIDGVLVVSPAPRTRHQLVLGNLNDVLRRARPSGISVFFAPFDVALGEHTVVEPDLLVAPSDAFTERDLPTAPLLAVEVLSPATRRVDLTLKKATYEAAGTPSYWVVDPDEVRVVAWELREGVYQVVAEVGSGETFTVERPYPVTFEVSALLDR